MAAELDPVDDPRAREQAFERNQALAVGALALPNLFLRSALTLGTLYGMLGLVLISLAYYGVFSAGFAVLIGAAIIVFQYVFGPFIMDFFLRFLRRLRWVERGELPGHLEAFVERVCDEHKMKFPSFGIIDDGAPEAFTYGHHPSNARVVISRGLIELLDPAELEAVVAHELGHARNWDMALMTVANLVPLALYYLYDLCVRYANKGSDNKSSGPAMLIGIGAYVLYIVSEYVVLWFSRTREYYADRFAGKVTGNPNALAAALVKIAYGLAAQDSKVAADVESEEGSEDEKKAARKKSLAGTGPLGALNIFDRSSAVSLVMAGGSADGGVAPERVKGAMQWDLWNPWAMYFELNSTHPLTAKRLLALSDQSAAAGATPYVVFDRKKPESYWDEFFVDLVVMWLPLVAFLAGLVGCGILSAVAGKAVLWPIGVGFVFFGLAGLLNNRFKFPRNRFEHATVETLLQRVKVSPVRPAPAVLTGRIIGKGVPGLIYSEDFVIRDKTGILFLDYQQPLGLWNFFFGLLRAGKLQGKKVTVRGWFRRAPVPYLEIDRLEVEGDKPRTCYTSYVDMAVAILALVGGLVFTFAALTWWR